MTNKIISLAIAVGTMALVTGAGLFGMSGPMTPTLALGFLLLSAYCIGSVLARAGLPQITGYIFAGLLFGPCFINFCSSCVLNDLAFLNSLALAFIAFCAGGELRLENIRSKLKIILYLIGSVTLVVFAGVTLAVFLLSAFIPFMSGYPAVVRLAVSAIFGVIAVARSPSSTIAIISETRSRGEYTDTVLGVTIVTDVVIIILFAVVISVCQLVIVSPDKVDVSFIFILLAEIMVSLLGGYLLGKIIVFLIEKVRVEFPVVIAGMGFVVIKGCHFMGTYLQEAHDISVNIEPLLICMAAGFTIQNFSEHGNVFLKRMDKISLPIYVAFFAITGATIDIGVLKASWLLGLVIVLVRGLAVFAGCRFSGRISGDRKGICANAWLGFITQAGVSLGLLAEVARRFPEIGGEVQSILIAAVTVNQIAGPVVFKYGLSKMGETGKQRLSAEGP